MESEVRKRVLTSKGITQNRGSNSNFDDDNGGLVGLPASNEVITDLSSAEENSSCTSSTSYIEPSSCDSRVELLNTNEILDFQENYSKNLPVDECECKDEVNIEKYNSVLKGTDLPQSLSISRRECEVIGLNSGLPHSDDVGLPVAENNDRTSLNGCVATDLNFREVPETAASKRKVRKIEDVLSKMPVNIQKLRKLAMSDGGLINDNIRKRAWAKLVGIDNIPPLKPLSESELEANGEYNQVVLDVNRSLKRFPPGIPYDQRVVLQDQLTRLIMRVIIKHPHLRYYQGYHDVAVTVLLVVGEEAAFPIMETLSTGHLNECMAETMDKTSYLLNYIYPLIKRMHPKLYEYMERSGCGTLFCLPWYLTWFGHNLNHYTDVVRLYDYFMSTDKLLPLYLAAAMVVYRSDEIFNVECDMPYIHSLLSNIPDDLPFEKLLKQAEELYKKFPPQSIEAEVEERVRLSQLPTNNLRDQRIRKRAPPIWNILQLNPRMGRYLIATATLAIGLYAYIRTASAIDVDALFPIR